MPAHWPGLNWRLVGIGAGRAERAPSRVGCGCASRFEGLVVGGPPVWVAEDRVGGDDVLEGGVRIRGLHGVAKVAGVGVVLAQESPVGVSDLLLGGVRGEAQDGVEVGSVNGHGHEGLRSRGGPDPPCGGPGPWNLLTDD